MVDLEFGRAPYLLMQVEATLWKCRQPGCDREGVSSSYSRANQEAIYHLRWAHPESVALPEEIMCQQS